MNDDWQQRGGSLIVNADDWGRDRETTDRTLECILAGAVSSVSAMVFMEDSDRSAAIANERGIDAGLHLNFTTPFSGGVPSRLAEHHERVARYLGRHRFAQTLFHPGLIRSFEYVVAAQCAEFTRVYGREPGRLDGHHHMHLCSNVLLGRLLPPGTVVRRNFSFRSKERSFGNRIYRRLVDRALARRHRLTDCFFSLTPLAPSDRLKRIFRLARSFVVELETHPVNPVEYSFLTNSGISSLDSNCHIASCFNVSVGERTYGHAF
jgi:YdjC-like protein